MMLRSNRKLSSGGKAAFVFVTGCSGEKSLRSNARKPVCGGFLSFPDHPMTQHTTHGFPGEVLAVECQETRVWCAVSSDDPEKIESRPIPREVIERLSRSTL